MFSHEKFVFLMSQTCFSCPITSHFLLITQTELLLVAAMSSSSSKPGAGPSRPGLASRSTAQNGKSSSSGSSSSSAASNSRSGNSASLIGKQTLEKQHSNALARSQLQYCIQTVDQDELRAMDSVEGLSLQLRAADRMMRVVGARLDGNDCTLLRFRREIFALISFYGPPTGKSRSKREAKCQG